MFFHIVFGLYGPFKYTSMDNWYQVSKDTVSFKI